MLRCRHERIYDYEVICDQVSNIAYRGIYYAWLR